MTSVTADSELLSFSLETPWHRDRVMLVAFLVSLLVHAVALTFLPGLRTPVPVEKVLTVKIAPPVSNKSRLSKSHRSLKPSAAEEGGGEGGTGIQRQDLPPPPPPLCRSRAGQVGPRASSRRGGAAWAASGLHRRPAAGSPGRGRNSGARHRKCVQPRRDEA
jgi:hypothetical protein